MALNSQERDKNDHDKAESELSAHAYCNGLVASQSNVDATSASMQETAHDWQEYKTMDKDFYDDGTITFFWSVYNNYFYLCKPSVRFKALFKEDFMSVFIKSFCCISEFAVYISAVAISLQTFY